MTARFVVAVVAFLFLAAESCAVVAAAEPDAKAGDWKLISDKEGVALYRRQRPLSYESKAVGEIPASTDLVHAVLDDLEGYSSFMPYTAECRVLKRDGDSVVAYQRISAPLASDRDYTVRVRTAARKVDGGTSYFSHWEADNAAGPPEKRGVIRVSLCEGSWLLEPAGPNATRATYTIYTDSGGVIPKFIKETGSQIGIRKLFAAVRKQVANPKYKEKAEGGGRKAEEN
jgi:hypothetical protein